MNIIQVTHGYPPESGGVQKVTQELSQKLVQLGHEVDVFTPGTRPKNTSPSNLNNLTVHYLPSITVAHTPIVPTLIFKLLRLPANSIIHVHVAKAFLPELVLLAAKIKNIPYIVHFHLDVNASGPFGFLLPFYKKYILKKVLASAKKVVVLSTVHQQFIKHKYGLSDNVVVIPNGVGEEYFLENKIGQDKIRNNSNLNLLYVGRLSVQKNVACLIDAVAKLKTPVTLDIVGDGELRPGIESQIKQYQLSNVHLHGRKTGQGLLDFYKKADVFLLASRQEGLPLVLLEAMAAGIAVVASDVIGNHEFVGDSGFLVNPPTPEGFAAVIELLAGSTKMRAEYSRKGIHKARLHSWEIVAKQFERIYSELESPAELEPPVEFKS